MTLTYTESEHGTDDGDRRRGMRIAQHRPVKVYEPSAARFFGGQTFDVSATGLRIELPVGAAVRPGKLLTIHVGLDESCSALVHRKHMSPARVVWVDRSRSDSQQRGRLEAGIEFLASVAANLDAA